MSVELCVYETPEGALQLSIEEDGGGYRLAGPKFDGRSTLRLKRTLAVEDIDVILRYLGPVVAP